MEMFVCLSGDYWSSVDSHNERPVLQSFDVSLTLA